MWTREDSPQPQQRHDSSKVTPMPTTPPPGQPAAVPPVPTARAVATMGSSLVIKGEMTGSEDILIEGRFEGKISFPGHLVTIGAQAKISAEVAAKAVIIQGSLTGNVTASERFEIRSGGCMDGDLISPKVVMAEGSEFCGRVDMRRASGSRTESRKDVRLESVAV